MKPGKIKNVSRTLLFVLLFIGLPGIGLWLFAGHSEGGPMQLQSKASHSYPEPGNNGVLPEIDLRVPGKTEFALFALG